MEINVREYINEGKDAQFATKLNQEANDAFIQYSSYNADEAYKRLAVVRRILFDFQQDIYRAGTNCMPMETIELYEAVKLMFREIENAEINTIKYGSQI